MWTGYSVRVPSAKSGWLFVAGPVDAAEARAVAAQYPQAQLDRWQDGRLVEADINQGRE